MTREGIVRWTCNICSTAVETAASSQPEGWVGYGLADPGEAGGSRTDIGHLCPDCYARVFGLKQVDLQFGASLTGGTLTLGTIRIDSEGMHCAVCGGPAHLSPDSTCPGSKS